MARGNRPRPGIDNGGKDHGEEAKCPGPFLNNAVVIDSNAVLNVVVEIDKRQGVYPHDRGSGSGSYSVPRSGHDNVPQRPRPGKKRTQEAPPQRQGVTDARFASFLSGRGAKIPQVSTSLVR